MSPATPGRGDVEAHLLVVEDEPNIRELLATSLRFAGFSVDVAADGESAMRLVHESDPELVVLDVMLPDTDGFEVASRLRASERHQPILFLTARDSLDDKLKGLTVGGDDYVTKPFSLEEVIARIRVILRRTQDVPSAESVLRFADVGLDDDAHEVRRAGVAVVGAGIAGLSTAIELRERDLTVAVLERDRVTVCEAGAGRRDVGRGGGDLVAVAACVFEDLREDVVGADRGRRLLVCLPHGGVDLADPSLELGVRRSPFGPGWCACLPGVER